MLTRSLLLPLLVSSNYTVASKDCHAGRHTCHQPAESGIVLLHHTMLRPMLLHSLPPRAHEHSQYDNDSTYRPLTTSDDPHPDCTRPEVPRLHLMHYIACVAMHIDSSTEATASAIGLITNQHTAFRFGSLGCIACLCVVVVF